MKMTKKRVAELEGAQLDWAVAKADGQGDDAWLSDFEDVEDAETLERVPRRWCMVPCQYDGEKAFIPSEEWAEAGPIIEREEINVVAPDLESVDHDRLWSADRHEDQRICYGPTPLIAAMRAFVASKLGDEVEVPE